MRILVYGDSNSWGYLDDGSGRRHGGRWPVAMAGSLAERGHDIELIEECLPGRTTTADDPESPTGDPTLLNGAGPLPAILLSQQPLDHILLMLGTNDMKTRFGRDAGAIAGGVMRLADIVRATPCGQGGWDGTEPARLTVICPPRLGARADDPNWIRFDEWRGGRATSAELLPRIFRRIRWRTIRRCAARRDRCSSAPSPRPSNPSCRASPSGGFRRHFSILTAGGTQTVHAEFQY